MKESDFDLATLSQFDPAKIGAYLHSHGWEVIDAHRSAEVWATRVRDTDTELLLPRTKLRDFALRMAELLQTLASVEHRPGLAIARDISLAGSDVFRVRRPIRGGGDAVPLVDGVKLVDYAFSLVAAAATAAVAPRKVLPSRKPAQARDYLEHVRLGQTEHGSYVVT